MYYQLVHLLTQVQSSLNLASLSESVIILLQKEFHDIC